MTSRGQEMEENQHPSFHSFTALMGDGCEFVSWCHADRKWKKINTHPSTLWQHLWVMVVSSSADVTQTGNGRASTAILPLFDSTCGRWFRVCQLKSHRKQMEEHPHPSFYQFTPLEGDGRGSTSWPHTSHSHTDRKWKKVVNHPSTDAHNHNTCRRWSWAHRRTLFGAAWSRLRCHHTRYWDRRLEREMKERGKRARSVEWWSDGDTVSLFNMTLKINLHPSPQPIPPTHTYPQPHTCTCS